MELSKRQLLTVQQALGYAVMYAKTESETAEFALLKLDIDNALIRQEADEQEDELIVIHLINNVYQVVGKKTETVYKQATMDKCLEYINNFK